jgi:hypothetical protein
MSSAGKLFLRIVWNGSEIKSVEVKSTRPQAYRILNGKMPDEVVQWVPMLFSVCGKAQQAAAIAALSVAQGQVSPQGLLERGVTCEAMQEHLWRLLLDWPKLLGLPPYQQEFVGWHAALNLIASGHGNAEPLLSELRRMLLGVDVAEEEIFASYTSFNAWKNRGKGLLAPILSALDVQESKLSFVTESARCNLQPDWCTADVVGIFADRLSHEFAARPQCEGISLETGELAHRQAIPLLQEVLRNHPHRLLARVIARLLDLLDSADALTHENSTRRIMSGSVSVGAGLSVVRTARGMLMHSVKIESGRIKDYVIVAPTEWNFHPQGTLVSGLTGLKENDAERLMQTVNNFVLSLDPCVEYEIGIAHA